MRSYLASLVSTYQPPRLPSLFDHGAAGASARLSVIVVTQAETQPSVAKALLEFAFVHYARVGFINETLAARECWTSEPLASLHPLDRHIAIGDAASGELLAYATFKAALDNGKLFSDKTRPLFAVERAYGRDVFDALTWLQSVPVEEVREVGRITRSAYIDRQDPRYSRASAELLLACMREILKASNRVSAVVGDGEPDIMIKNIRSMGAAPEVVHGRDAQLPADHIYSPRYLGRIVRPFAFRTAAIDHEKLFAVQQALSADDDNWQRIRERMRSTARPTYQDEHTDAEGGQAS